MSDRQAPPLGVREMARWFWRQLTSMRVALILLFLLAVAAIPGSLVPQRGVEPLEVSDFRSRNPGLSEWYDRLGLFDVYTAPWFAAIYLALLVSLLGCIIPRVGLHWKALRGQPPPAPRRLARMPAYRADVLPEDTDPSTDAGAATDPGTDSDAVLAAASAELRARRYRMAPAAGGGDSVGGEKGYLREAGNLVFHLGVVAVLLAVAVGGLFGYRGTVLVPEGQGFANSIIQYDSLDRGALFESTDLPPFSLTVEEFTMDFFEDGPNTGAAEDFEATVEFVAEPGAEPQTRSIRVNEPLEVGGTLVHILNPGYAPALTVRSAEGDVLATGPVPFLPQDNSFTSNGVVKASVPSSVNDGTDIGIEGIFLPTAVLDEQGPRSVFPEPRNPAIFLTAYHGDLGLDDGEPQSVYRLDQSELEQFETENGPFRAALSEGETVELPNGAGTVTFDGYVRWVNLQVSRNAGKEAALASAVVAVVGLLGSLYIRRRRVWVRAGPDEHGCTVMEVAGLHRSDVGDLQGEIDNVADAVRRRLEVGGAEHRSADEPAQEG